MGKRWSERLPASHINPNVERPKHQFAEVLIPLYDPISTFKIPAQVSVTPLLSHCRKQQLSS